MSLAVLSIEDSLADFRLIERALKQGGVDAHCQRSDDFAGLQAALAQEWDLILSDYNLPGLCFEDIIADLCTRWPQTPVILVSGSVGEEKAVELLKLGAWDFVLKDRLVRLAPAIARCLREAAERRSRHSAECALRESEAQLRLLGDNLPDGAIYQLVMTAEGERSFTYMSQGIEHLSGLSAQDVEANAHQLYARIHPDDLHPLLAAELQSRASGAVFDFETRILHRDGSLRWLYLRSSPRRMNDGRTLWDGVVIDITTKRDSREQLRLAASVFENSLEGIIVTDPKHHILDINPAFFSITGYTRDEALGMNLFAFSQGLHDDAYFNEIWQSLARNKFWRGELWTRRKSGEVFPELLSITAVCDESGRTLRYVSVFTDISRIKSHEAELDRMAHYDRLTGMPNRQMLALCMEEAIGRVRQSDMTLAVCYLDLDGFKAINERFGHDTGDQLLIHVVKQLREMLGPNETLARLGGDEFVLLLHLLPDSENILVRLEHIQKRLAQPPSFDATAISISASIGVTLFPHDDSDAETLLRHADQAMYGAKEAGRNRYHFYDLDHEHQIASRRTHLHRLAEALAQGEFTLYFQPMVNLATLDVVSAEALIRWQHPERGIVAPGEFLGFIEGTELEIAVGEWVIETVLDQVCAWRTQGLSVRASANVSARQLLRPGFVPQLAAALARHPTYVRDDLELEILESAAISDLELARDTLNACCEFGVCFALDDFGTGYASLTYFRKLPVETLKIDQTFVRDMLSDPEDLGIVESVIRLAELFDRAVVAEGVETAAHGERLLQLGCQLAQGYGIARPMPAAEFPNWVTQWRARAAASAPAPASSTGTSP